MDYEAVIGLEIHAQLTTRAKMFCGCAADYAAAPPNTRVCPVCLGAPGVLPVINRRAVEYTIMTALALHCEIPPISRFDRKSYPYPDLMKGYQISQYDMPLSRQGWVEVEIEGEKRLIGIRRVHLEEDTAKLTHYADHDHYSLVDVNRSGVPLMEIVSEPDMRAPEEARLYVAKLRQILVYLGVCSGNLQEGSMRLEANISLRRRGSEILGTKVEIKNMNSLRAVRQALEYEIERQAKVLQEGGRIRQETRGWDEDKGRTVVQRVKESAEDYRYFPEPDLPPLVLDREWVEGIRAQLPELPDAKRERFITQYSLSDYDATLLTEEKEVADYFEAVLKAYPEPKTVANWVTGELFRLLRGSPHTISTSPVTPEKLAELLAEVDKGTVSISTGKAVLDEMFASGQRAQTIIVAKGLAQISDETRLAQVVEEVIAQNPAAVADFRKGKEGAIRFLVGQVMKATRGQANPQMATDLLRQKLVG